MGNCMKNSNSASKQIIAPERMIEPSRAYQVSSIIIQLVHRHTVVQMVTIHCTSLPARYCFIIAKSEMDQRLVIPDELHAEFVDIAINANPPRISVNDVIQNLFAGKVYRLAVEILEENKSIRVQKRYLDLLDKEQEGSKAESKVLPSNIFSNKNSSGSIVGETSKHIQKGSVQILSVIMENSYESQFTLPNKSIFG